MYTLSVWFYEISDSRHLHNLHPDQETNIINTWTLLTPFQSLPLQE